MRSRVTLATIDAAAIDIDNVSPLMIEREGMARSGNVTASIKRQSAGGVSDASARRMARRVASKILRQSISCSVATPTPTARARADNHLVESRALRLGDLFGIVDTDQAATSGQDHRRRDDRARQRASSGFIQTGDTAIAAPPGFQFKFVGRSHDASVERAPDASRWNQGIGQQDTEIVRQQP